MARFCGVIGFAETVETLVGVWEDVITERRYFGNITKNSRRMQDSGQLNNDITVSNEISIIADPFANQNFFAIRYVEFMGVKWTVTNVDVQYPRLILTLGGVYNVRQD